MLEGHAINEISSKKERIRMILSRDGIETKVKVIPYTESTIQSGQYLQTPTIPIEVTSVKDYEERLV